MLEQGWTLSLWVRSVIFFGWVGLDVYSRSSSNDMGAASLIDFASFLSGVCLASRKVVGLLAPKALG